MHVCRLRQRAHDLRPECQGLVDAPYALLAFCRHEITLRYAAQIFGLWQISQ